VARTAVALAFRAPGIGVPRDVVALDVLQAHWNEGQDAVLRRVLQMNAAEEDSDVGSDSQSSSQKNNGANTAPESSAHT
jgi:hypothetical protein